MKLGTPKRFTKRARVWVKFCDGTSESFSVPESLVSALAPVVAAKYPHSVTWVENRWSVIRHDDNRVGGFAASLRGMFGGSRVQGGCDVCGCVEARATPAIAGL